MQTIAPDSRLYVVVGVVGNAEGKLLLQQRQAGKPCAGQWEFPGGKLENNEIAREALTRELREELGIEVVSISPLTQLGYDYDHARVWLDVYQINQYSGTVIGMEDQKLAWLSEGEIRDKDILPPVLPILDAVKAR